VLTSDIYKLFGLDYSRVVTWICVANKFLLRMPKSRTASSSCEVGEGELRLHEGGAGDG
jgi:hypothetical protein